jgi:isopentenyldiphosphate isomerase
MMQELLDVLTPDGVLTGEVKPRTEIHREGLWHRSFHLWIIKERRYVLFQRRAKTKDLEPGKLDVTVGGHFGAGETLKDVIREVEEEIGLQVNLGELRYLETRPVERFYPHAVDREFQEVYALHCDQELDQYFLNRDEVHVLYEVPLERAVELYREGTPVAAAGFDAYRRPNHALLIPDDLIEQARPDVVDVLEKIEAWLKS